MVKAYNSTYILQNVIFLQKRADLLIKLLLNSFQMKPPRLAKLFKIYNFTFVQ